MAGRRVLEILRQPSWIGLTLLVVVLCVTFTELGLWQLRRHDERAAANQVLIANLERAPAPVAEVLPVDHPLASGEEWRMVTATGTYDREHELLVRNRTFDGELGFEVVTPLVPPSGPAIVVVRGWVPNGPDATSLPAVPPPPAGEVTVSARARVSPHEGLGDDGLPAGQIRQLDVPAIADTLPYDVIEGGYAQLVPLAPGSDESPTGPRALTIPEISSGPHRPYAVQWFLFGVIALGGWAVLLRAAVREGPARRSDPFRRPPAVTEPR